MCRVPETLDLDSLIACGHAVRPRVPTDLLVLHIIYAVTMLASFLLGPPARYSVLTLTVRRTLQVGDRF